jgi:hypothetical protein
MCFRPNNRASIDQAPGPIIAKLALEAASTRASVGLLRLEKATQSSTAAVVDPAIGVHSPTRRNNPVAAAIQRGASTAGPADVE